MGGSGYEALRACRYFNYRQEPFAVFRCPELVLATLTLPFRYECRHQLVISPGTAESEVGPREHTMRTPTMQFESFSRRAIAAALLSVPLATTPAVAFDNALPGREARAAAKKTPGPSPGRQKGHAGSQRLQ